MPIRLEQNIAQLIIGSPYKLAAKTTKIIYEFFKIMIQELVKQWEENKHKLEEYFKTTRQEEYSSSYKQIVTKLFELCLPKADNYRGFNLNKMTVIDDGDYQGTQIFIIPKNIYQPSVKDYIMTNTYYGSCSGCDTLLRICNYEDDLPTDEQVKEYMTLALHLVQKLKWLDVKIKKHDTI